MSLRRIVSCLLAGLCMLLPDLALGQDKSASLKFDLAVHPELSRFLELLEYPGYAALVLDANNLLPNLRRLKIGEDGRSVESRNAVLKFVSKKGAVYTYEAGVVLRLVGTESHLTFPVVIDAAAASFGRVEFALRPPLVDLFAAQWNGRIQDVIAVGANPEMQARVARYLDGLQAKTMTSTGPTSLIDAVVRDVEGRKGVLHYFRKAAAPASVAQQWFLLLIAFVSGALILSAAFLGVRNLLWQQGFLSRPTTPSAQQVHRRTRWLGLIASALSILLFASTVVFLRDFKPESAGFEQRTPWLQLYHLGRVLLVPYILVLCYCVGFWSLKLLGIDPRSSFERARHAAILSFFFGASLYGLAFSALGLLGLLNLATALLLTAPVFIWSGPPLKAMLGNLRVLRLRAPDAFAGEIVLRAAVVATAAAIVLFVICGVVYVAVYDPNIWEHYVHYYRAVLASGSTLPNEVWHHFYASKGAGLILLTNLLSDYFGVQIVSAVFALAAGLILVDLLLLYCTSLTWAFVGLILFFAYLAGNSSSGEMFKHHGVILAYAAFALWASIRLQMAKAGEARPLFIVSILSLFYFGFYQPVATALFPLAFLFFVIANRFLKEPARWSLFFWLGCAVAAGTALDLFINWGLTGLLEVTPMRLTWAIADQSKVQEVFGRGGIDFFLSVNNNLSSQYDWSLDRVRRIIRLPFHIAVLPITLIAMTVLFTQVRNRGELPPSEKFIAYVAAFLLPLGAFALAVQTAAVDRMALFSIVYSTLALIVIWKRLVEICLDEKLWRAATIVVLVGAGGLALSQAVTIWGKQRQVIYKLAKGGISIKDAFRAVEALNRETTGIDVGAMHELRKTMTSEQRVLRLSYDSGFAYALPGNGIVSEPTYGLIEDPRKLITAEAGEVEKYLRDRNIHYFTINLRNLLFSTVAFTSLFDPQEMQRRFSVAYELGDYFILQWRRSDDAPPLPEHLLVPFELKRTGALHYPFSEAFAIRVVTGDRTVATGKALELAIEAFYRDADAILKEQVLTRLSLERSKVALRNAVMATSEALDDVLPVEGLFPSRRSADGELRLLERVTERDVRTRLLPFFREALYKEYVRRYGDQLAVLGRDCDERAPFAMDPSITVCF